MPELYGRIRSAAEKGKQVLKVFALFAVMFFRPLGAAAQDEGVSAEETVQPHGSYGIKGSVLENEALLSDAESGLSRLYNMEYESADSIFLSIEGRYPDHPIGPFLRALVLWWRILPALESGTEASDEAFYAAMAEVIKRSDRLLDENDQDFDAMFFKGAALGFRGRLLSNRRKWLRAAKDGKKALEYVFDIARADTLNADFQFGTGVYNYFASVIPQKYPIVKPILFFFPDADREAGIRSLKFTAAEGRLIRTEATYFLLQIYLFYEPDFEESVQYSSWLTRRYPDNAFFRLLQGRVYVRWNQWSRAMNAFEWVIDGHEEGRAGYTDALAAAALYFKGRYDVQGNRFEDALVAFRGVEILSAPQRVDSFYRVNALLRLGMIHDIRGARKNALAAYRSVLKLEDRGEAHKKARLFKKEPYQSQ